MSSLSVRGFRGIFRWRRIVSRGPGIRALCRRRGVRLRGLVGARVWKKSGLMLRMRAMLRYLLVVGFHEWRGLVQFVIGGFAGRWLAGVRWSNVSFRWRSILMPSMTNA